MKNKRVAGGVWWLALWLGLMLVLPGGALAQADDVTPPQQPVKLVFIHHSTGENWLADDYGGLGRALAANNYYVSDTNYGWGPDGIGDRTDIPDWLAWFASEQTETYMQALFNESEQHAPYSRTFGDPGGENVIVVFKSCFPNSALEGNPNDPPNPEPGYSVGHARYVYNQILGYFASRPDKLFVVITAPPLSDGTYAANARAFNDWLVNDWLAENNYTLPNVAVFDFYNVLTAPEAHHRYLNGSVEHLATNRNTLYYPSDDDHPSASGSRKASEEFLPLLNLFYHRWAANAPAAPIQRATPTPGAAIEEPVEPTSQPANGQAAGAASLIDDFEGPNSLSSGWQAFRDEIAATQMECGPSSERAYAGVQALKINATVAPESWATCELAFDQSQNWADYQGVRFWLQAEQAGLAFHVNVFAGAPESSGLYFAAVQAGPESVAGWQMVQLNWADFQRVAWEENGGAPLPGAEQISSILFGFDHNAAMPGSSVVWIDRLELVGTEEITPPPLIAPAPANATATQAPSATPEATVGNPLCGSAIAPLLLLLITCLGVIAKERNN